MKADFVRCACTRINDPWRRFCGGCGRQLEPACTCGFVNGKSEVFCGGCGVCMKPRTKAATGDDSITTPIEIIDIIG